MALPAIDPDLLPSLPAAPQRNLFAAGLSSGVDELQGLLGSATEYAGRGLGISPIEQFGARVAERNAIEAQQNGRPDLEIAPWRQGGASVLPWLAYQTTKQLPVLGAYLLGSALVPEAAVPAGLARLGAAVPEVLGGGGLRAGANFAARRAALDAGTTFGRRAVAGEAVGIPLAAGSMFQEAKQAHPEGVSNEDLGKIGALSPFYAALDAIDIPLLSGLKNVSGGVVKKAVKASIVGSAEELVQEGVQTAMEQSFRTDLSPQDKMANIVEGAVTGAAVGGVLGGIASIRRARPNDIATDQLGQAVDQELGVAQQITPSTGALVPLGATPQVAVDRGGTAQFVPSTIDFTQSEFDQQPVSRPFANAPQPELETMAQTMANYLKAHEKGGLDDRGQKVADQYQQVLAELNFRGGNVSATNDNITSQTAGAVERRSDVKGVAASNSAAPAPATFEQQRTELFKGVAPATRRLFTDATSMDELDAKLRQELENGRASKSILALAERRGIDLNEPAKVAAAEPGVQTETGTATSVATSQGTNTEPAAPANAEGGDQTVDADFQAKWQERIKGVKDFGLKELRGVKRLIPEVPANEEQAKLAIYDALGTVDRQDRRVDGYKGVEQLAQEYDLVDDNGQLTDEGVRIARMRIPLEDTVKEAVSRGYSGAEANAFNKGALGQRKVTLGSIAELQAYNDGQQWALDRNSKTAPIPATASNTETESVLEENTAQKGGEHTVRSAVIPEKQKGMQLLNAQIDQVYGSTLQPTEQAQLKRMVREGATKEDIDEAARYMATGQGALVQEQPQREPYRGEVVTRGAPRNQERLRQIRGEPARAELERKLSAPEREVQTQEAIDRFKRRQAARDHIQRLVEDVEAELAAEKELHDQELNIDDSGVLKSSRQQSSNPFMAGVASEKLEKSIGQDGRVSPRVALTFLKQEASNTFERHLALKIDKALRRLSAGGWKIDIRVVRPGDTGPPGLATARGLTVTRQDGRVEVWLNSSQMTGREGTGRIILAHEMVHAATAAGIEAGKLARPNSPLAKASEDLMRVTARIRDHFRSLDQANMTPFQREILMGRNNALDDEHEIIAWALTDPEMQAYLESIPYTQNQTFWSRLVEAIRNFLGLDSKDDTALSGVLKAADKLLVGSPTRNELQVLLNQSSEPQEVVLGASSSVKTSMLYQQGVKSVIGAADRIRDTDGARGKVRKMTLGWMSVHGANEFYGDWFNRLSEDGKQIVANGVRAYEEALNTKNAIFARLSLMATDVMDRFDRLPRKSAEDINVIMQASQFGINPMRPWREQHESLRNSTNAKNLEQLTKQYHDLYRALLSRGHADVYQNLNRVNDTQMLATLAMSLHQQVDATERGAMDEFSVAPMDAYMSDQTTRDFTPAQAREWWAGLVDRQVKAVYSHLDQLRSERDNPSTDTKTQENLKSRIDPLGKRAKDISDAVQALDNAPYFHLGRYGNYIVSWTVADEDALARVADALSDAGFDGVITNGTEKREVFMRVENTTQWKNLHNLVQDMARKGAIDPASIRARQRTAEDYTAGVDLQWINNLIAGFEESDIDEDTKREAVDALKARALDLTPEISITRVLTKRKSIPGFSADMMRSFAWRNQVGINALAGQSVAPKITKSFVDMRGALEDSEADTKNVPLNQISGMRDIIDEYSRRERERSMWPHSKILDQLSGVATAWFLGFSASYGFVNTTQLGVTLLPELGARHGFANAFSAMAKATPVALKIMREVAKHGHAVSLDRAMDAVITQDVLRKVVGADMAEYLMRVVNTGNLDIGGPSRELVRAAEGRGDEHLDRVLRYASSIGYYTETASRLIAAIATKQLSPQLSTEAAADRAAYVINETMWNYSQTNQGRQFGKMGVLGQYSPLALKFMQFQAQLTEKLMREGYNAIKGETKAERSEARRYLMGHLSAMTVLAGTLGLPAATVFASVIDRLKDLWDDDDEPSNVRAAYRNWLADAFGVKAGELVSHGVFRAAGFDISQRIGEQDIVPFSRFIADRRDAKDSTKDLAFRTWGAPTSLIAGLVEGGQKVMDGDISGGLTKMLPNAFAAPVKAYTLTQDGYTDANGKKLPMEPGAFDIMTQLLGFNPSAKAEYSEARQDQAVRKGLLIKQASNLRNQILDAVAQNDNETARDLIARAQQFDQANPAFAVLPRLGASARSRARANAVSRSTAAPLGVSIRDLEGQQISRYANY